MLEAASVKDKDKALMPPPPAPGPDRLFMQPDEVLMQTTRVVMHQLVPPGEVHPSGICFGGQVGFTVLGFEQERAAGRWGRGRALAR